MNIILYGCPRPVGGACVEAGDTALLWRKMGIQVTVLAEGPGIPDNPWPTRLLEAGCILKQAIQPDDLAKHPCLHDSIVVDFACEQAVKSWDRLARIGCRLIHVGCHNYAMPHEHNAFRHRPPTAVVYQSKYQQQWMSLQYSAWGVPDDRQRLIHGAFDAESFPFQPRPHIPGEPFVVGTIGRAVGAKWPKRLASILAAARERTPVDGNWLGWHPSVERYSGQVPPWVRTRLPGAVPIAEFLSECHALLVVPDCPENWSRVVLEALACGVPVIASNDGGIPEQIRHEENGLLASYEDEATAAVVRLATDEPFRLMIAENGRKSLSCLANREATGSAWRSLFASLQNS